MQIQIKNIGKIKEAIVDLDGLSVIAGSNDTGKTTVSKVAFSVIKALQKYKEFSNLSKDGIIKDHIEGLYRHSRTIFSFLRQEKKEEAGSIFNSLKNIFEPNIFRKSFIESTDKISFLEENREFIKNVRIDDFLKNSFYELLSKIEEEYLKEETNEYLVEKALNHIFDSEFNGELNCLTDKGEIFIKDGELDLFNISVKKNKATVKIKDEFLKIKDATFINSPIILDFFNESRFIKLQYHYEDLFNKINNISLNNQERKNGFWKEIKKTIKGNFELNDDFVGKTLTFSKEGIDGNIEVINTATGIKSFGILDLLDKSNCLDSDDLLILDEPEVHLHPEWQVKYAELIAYLIKERGLSVLITSHSPYMIEALSKFSKNINIKADFYLAEESKKGKININDKTGEKYEIFQKLSKPFKDLMLK